MHGKDIAKENRQRYKLLGNEIDGYIQDMSNGQTNGIPQGSVLMDFIAEIVLGYADSELSEKIEKESIKEYKILRYRDDYRIFVNNSQDGEIITKLLSETLIDLGLKLNAHKTQSSQNIIRDSIKSDKLFWITQNKNEQNLQKKLIIIHNLAVKFPNSGSIKRALSEYLDAIPPLKDIKEEPLPLISVLTDIACYSPDVFPIYAAILNQFIKLLATNDEKKNVFQKGSNCRNDRKVPKMSINPYFSRALGSTQTIFTILAIRSFPLFLRQFFQQFQTRNIEFY